MGTAYGAMGDACAVRALSRCPIPWAKHAADNAGNPCINQLIEIAGYEGYGRYWRLVELLLGTETHSIPDNSEQGYKRYTLGLKFEDAEKFEEFIELLVDLDLAAVDESGRRYIPLVDEAALSVAKNRFNGSKGGKAAARNRQAKPF